MSFDLVRNAPSLLGLVLIELSLLRDKMAAQRALEEGRKGKAKASELPEYDPGCKTFQKVLGPARSSLLDLDKVMEETWTNRVASNPEYSAALINLLDLNFI